MWIERIEVAAAAAVAVPVDTGVVACAVDSVAVVASTDDALGAAAAFVAVRVADVVAVASLLSMMNVDRAVDDFQLNSLCLMVPWTAIV